MKKTSKKKNLLLTVVWATASIFAAQSQVHEHSETQPQDLRSNRAADPGVGGGHGNNRDLWMINNDSSNHLSQLRMQTSNKAFTFTNRVTRMSLSYETGSNWKNGEGKEIFSIQKNGETRMSNSYIGSVNDDLNWAGFMHISLSGSASSRKSNYALATTETGKFTLVNKKNTGDGYIGFTVGNASKMVITNNGNVGIGTSSPTKKLDVVGYGKFRNSASNFLEFGHGGSHSFLNHNGVGNLDFRYQDTNLMTLAQNGNLGIGTRNPKGELQLSNTVRNRKIVLFQGADNDHNFYGLGINTNALRYQSSANHVFYSYVDANTSKEVFRINEDGKVVIGQSELSSSTEDTNTVLTVSGGIKTDKVVLNIGSFPDYVFEDDYALMSIEEVAEYVTKNKHLPNIPSEKEMVATGLDVNTMSLKMVEKIEELTLYTIQQEEKLKSQNQLIIALTKRLERLENKK